MKPFRKARAVASAEIRVFSDEEFYGCIQIVFFEGWLRRWSKHSPNHLMNQRARRVMSDWKHYGVLPEYAYDPRDNKPSGAQIVKLVVNNNEGDAA